MENKVKDAILESLKGIKVMLQDAGVFKKDPVENTIETIDGKELKFTGELVEGIEIKCGDAAIEDGTIELKDGRKLTAKEGKFLKFETLEDPNEALKAEVEALKSERDAQKETIKNLEAKFTSVIEASTKTLEAVESIALALEAEPAPKGGDGTGMISKSEWVVEQTKK